MRTLTFAVDDPNRQQRFDCLVIAVYSAGDKTSPRNRLSVQLEAEMLDALDAVSTSVETEAPMLCTNCGAAQHARHAGQAAVTDRRRLVYGDQTLTLSELAYARLGHYLETAPWLPSASRQAVDVMDWFARSEPIA